MSIPSWRFMKNRYTAQSKRDRSRPRWRPTLEALEDRTLLSTAIPLNSQSWTPIGPADISNTNTSGRITGVAGDPTDPNTIYIAAAGGGVWKTSDAGLTWTPLTDNQATDFMGAVAVAPSNHNIIYAGTGEANFSLDSFYGRGILVSNDAGATWQLKGNSIFDRSAIAKIAIDPFDPNTVFVAATNAAFNGGGAAGIWKTTDGGNTWSSSLGGEGNDVIMDPTNDQIIYASTQGTGIFKSIDGGSTWTQLGGRLPSGNGPGGALEQGRIALAISHTNSPQTIYTVISDSGAFDDFSINPPDNRFGTLFKFMKSTDGGLTWADQTFGMPQVLGGQNFFRGKAGQGWYDIAVAVDPTNANIVYVGGTTNFGGAGIVESTDGGNTWSVIPGGTHTDIHAFDFDANGKLLNGNDGGIYRLDNPKPSALKWADLNSNLQITQFTGVALHPTDPNIAYGGSQDNGTEKFNSVPGWKQVVGGDGGFVRVDGGHPDTVYHTFNYGMNFLERSDDGGVTWAAKTNGIDFKNDFANFYPPYVIDPAASNRLLLGTNRLYETVTKGEINPDPLYKGADGAQHAWRPLLTLGTPIDAIGIAQSNPDVIYVAAGGTVLVTFTHGASWSSSSIPGAKDIKVDPVNPFVAYVVTDIFTGGTRHVFRTTSGGTTWNDITGNLPDIPVNSVLLDPWTKVLYVGTDIGVFASNDYAGTSGGPVHWVVLKSGFPHAQVVDLEMSTVSLQLTTRGYILGAGTHGRGMWELDTTHFSASAPLEVTAGTPFNITVNALDPFDQKILGYTGVYTGTVSVTSLDPQFSPPVPYSFTSQDDDTHTFSVTLNTQGMQTITVSDAVDGVDPVTITVQVDPAPASKFQIIPPGQATAGTPFGVTVTALDAFNNITTFYAGTIHFTTSDLQTGVSVPADYTFVPGTDNGSHTFPQGFVLDTAGVQTITATDTSNSSITGNGRLTVVATAATHLTVSAPSTVQAGAVFAISVSALDQFNNIAPTYRGQVHFTTTDTGSAILLPGNYTFTSGDGGTHTFTNSTTLNTGGNQTITATDTASSSVTGSTTVLVTAGTVSHLTVIAPSTVIANAPFSVTVQARDRFENVVPTFLDGVSFSATDTSPLKVLPGTYTFVAGDAGSHTFVNGFVLITAGPQTLTAKDNAFATIKGTATLTVNNPVPVITGLNPPSVVEQNGDFTLTVNGSGFVPSSMVNWNGQALTTTLVSSGQLQAAVPGALVADENTVAVTVSNPTPGGGTSNSQSFATTDAPLNASVSPITGTEGTAFSGQVATFTDANTNAPLSDFPSGPNNSLIDWGDGSTSAGIVTQAGGPGTAFLISSNHTYVEDGTYTVKVTVTDIGGATVTATGTAVISDANLTGAANDIGVVRDLPFSGTVATFTDANPNAPLSDFANGVTIAWGDGATTSGTVTQPGGVGTQFVVNGNHTFTNPGAFTITVTVNDLGGATFSSNANVRVTKRFDIVGRASQTGQLFVGTSDGSSFSTSVWGSFSTAVTWVDVQSGDFNGDGRADYVGRVLQSGDWWVALSNGTSFTNVHFGAWSPTVTWVDVKVGDFNGDGKADIAGRWLQTGQWWIAQSTGSSFTNLMWATWNPGVTWTDVNVGDFNGDGKTDITGRASAFGQWYTGLSTGSSFNTSFWAAWSATANWVDVKVGDFNGDGKSDIVGRWGAAGQWYVGLSTGSSFNTSLWATWNPAATWVDVNVGDFNGDGKSDIIGRWLQGGTWFVAQSTGVAFNTSAWANWNPNVTWANVVVGDFNSDGKTDIAGQLSGAGQWWTGLSTGSSLSTSLWATWPSNFTWVDVHADNYAL
jgi:hypothetical protein